MIKRSIQREDITIVNIYAPSISKAKYTKQILTDIQGAMDSSTIVVGNLIPHLHQWTDHPDRKLIRKQKL